MGTGININDVPLDLFLKYFDGRNSEIVINTPITEDFKFVSVDSETDLAENNKTYLQKSAGSKEYYDLLLKKTGSSFGEKYESAGTDVPVYICPVIIEGFKERYKDPLSRTSSIGELSEIKVEKLIAAYDNDRNPEKEKSNFKEEIVDILTFKKYLKYEVSVTNSEITLVTALDNVNISGYNEIPYFSGYTAYINNNKSEIIIQCNTKEIPATTSDGKNLYVDDCGLRTTEPYYDNNFYKQQNALRKNFFGITEKMDWVNLVDPNKVYLLQRNNTNTLALARMFTEEKIYSVTSDSEIIDGVRYNSSVFPRSIYNNVYNKLIAPPADGEYRTLLSNGNYEIYYKETNDKLTHKEIIYNSETEKYTIDDAEVTIELIELDGNEILKVSGTDTKPYYKNYTKYEADYRPSYTSPDAIISRKKQIVGDLDSFPEYVVYSDVEHYNKLSIAPPADGEYRILLSTGNYEIYKEINNELTHKEIIYNSETGKYTIDGVEVTVELNENEILNVLGTGTESYYGTYTKYEADYTESSETTPKNSIFYSTELANESYNAGNFNTDPFTKMAKLKVYIRETSLFGKKINIYGDNNIRVGLTENGNESIAVKDFRIEGADSETPFVLVPLISLDDKQLASEVNDYKLKLSLNASDGNGAFTLEGTLESLSIGISTAHIKLNDGHGTLEIMTGAEVGRIGTTNSHSYYLVLPLAKLTKTLVRTLLCELERLETETYKTIEGAEEIKYLPAAKNSYTELKLVKEKNKIKSPFLSLLLNILTLGLINYTLKRVTTEYVYCSNLFYIKNTISKDAEVLNASILDGTEDFHNALEEITPENPLITDISATGGKLNSVTIKSYYYVDPYVPRNQYILEMHKYTLNRNNEPSGYATQYIDWDKILDNSEKTIDVKEGIRGKYIADGRLLEKRKEALIATIQKLLSTDSSHIDLGIEFANTNGTERLYNFCKGYTEKVNKEAIRNVPEEAYEKQYLSNIDNINNQLILRDKTEETEERTILVPTMNIIPNVRDDRSLIKRITQYKKYPLSYLYEQEKSVTDGLKDIDPYAIINNNVNLHYNEMPTEAEGVRADFEYVLDDVRGKVIDLICRAIVPEENNSESKYTTSLKTLQIIKKLMDATPENDKERELKRIYINKLNRLDDMDPVITTVPELNVCLYSDIKDAKEFPVLENLMSETKEVVNGK